jgi:DNA-directed RNA polymerase subunit RPC12/RpoP
VIEEIESTPVPECPYCGSTKNHEYCDKDKDGDYFPFYCDNCGEGFAESEDECESK